MPRILSLDKILQDLRGAAAADSAKQGFMQGLQQGRVDAVAKEAAQSKLAAEQGQAAGKAAGEAAAHAGDQSKGVAAGQAQSAAMAEGLARNNPLPGGPPVHPDYDQLATQYFEQLAAKDKAAAAPDIRAGADVNALDAAQLAQGGAITKPGAAPP